MKILIRNGRVMDQARGLDQQADVAIDGGKVLAIGKAPEGFAAEREIDAAGCWVLPGLVDLAVRLREPGHEHEGMLQSEMAASVAGGDRKSTRLNSSHGYISYAVFCLKKKQNMPG